MSAAEEKRLWQEERKALLPVFLFQFALSSLLTFGALYGLYYHCDCIPVPKSDEFKDKLTYYIRCCVFPCCVLLLLAILGVANKRGRSRAANPLAGREHLLMVEKNFLTNTLEQTVLFLMIALTLTTYLGASEMKALPVYTIVWLIGRILFRIGYGIHPKYRSCGISSNFNVSFVFLSLLAYMMYTRGFMYGIPSEVFSGTGAPTPRSEL